MGANHYDLYPLKMLYEAPDSKFTNIKVDVTECVDKTQHNSLYSSMLVNNLNNIFKFLALCAIGRPLCFSDQELLIFIPILCRVSLDTNLKNQPKEDLRQLLIALLNNMTEWHSQMPKLCLSLSQLSSHHHNMLSVVQLLPDTISRGRELRKRLSLTIIAKLLCKNIESHFCNETVQLSFLCQLLKYMTPSTLKQQLEKCHRKDDIQDETTETAWQSKLDWEACYLCHTLLTLANIVVGTETLTSDTCDVLQRLCTQLDRYVSNIRENPCILYRSKLKDLATYTHVRWKELLSHCVPQRRYHWNPCSDFKTLDSQDGGEMDL
ncbi:protein FAM178B [Discoglossus pictus]